ncbi:tRNA-dihydrouridine synthase [Ophiocordyceps sinensis CO18]|uniref:tRNA-dihydrouridine synthase n=1 Tax=Ophiocordyceps sinensis (strain Co18 / CGMCC 3.14243) TaxID=911162 RepID=T5ABQ9_OPHSC|nr:tRNA-dihydrouridine synthase [Ophiocordyceps sinensis CO18]
MTLPSKRVPIPRRGVDYRGKVVLAPMVRSGELPSRLLALEYGADLVWGPETVDHAMLGATKRFNEHSRTFEWFRVASHGLKVPPPDAKESIIFRSFPEREASKLIFQIGTSDPERAVKAARMVAEHVAGIDVNAGCPKPFSTSGGMGAELLKTPDKLCAILEALVQNITPEHEIGGGLLPWLTVVDNYLRTSIEVHNPWGNTKFLLSQMIPGKEKLHQRTTQEKTHSAVCRILGLEHLAEQALEADARLGLDKPQEKKASKKAKSSASAMAAGGQQGRAREQTRQRMPLSERNASRQARPGPGPEPEPVAPA